jgi:hypothetical protein
VSGSVFKGDAMGPVSTFAYAQARLQARLGARPDDADWLRLQEVRGFTPFLETAHSTPLRTWLDRLATDGGVHELELSLRRYLLATIEESAGWLPPAWRPAVRWTSWLPYLPALDYLLSDEPILAWMSKDPTLAAYLKARPDERLAMMKNGPLAPLATAKEQGRSLRDGWIDSWRRLWPEHPSTAPLEALAQLVQSLLAVFADSPPAQAGDNRTRFEEALRRHLRRNLFHPAAVFAYLALTALDTEKLRGALVQRLLFASEEP